MLTRHQIAHNLDPSLLKVNLELSVIYLRIFKLFSETYDNVKQNALQRYI